MIEAIFHGHSFVELQREGKSILIDPFIEGNTQCDKTSEYFIKKNLHAIIVTHAHFDHI
jgi:L-ascorbate metabolism protein UlaG (beta-lactamase superfamily)